MNRMALAVQSALGVSLMVPAALIYAQTASPTASDGLEEVVVTGIRASLEQSLEAKRNGHHGRGSRHAPKTSARCPTRTSPTRCTRVPGVTTSSAGANEGGFDENDRVSMRGTNPSLTQTLINGHGVAAGDWFVLDQVQHRRPQCQLHAAALGAGQPGGGPQELARPRSSKAAWRAPSTSSRASRSISRSPSPSKPPPAPSMRTCPPRPTPVQRAAELEER